MGSVNNNKKYRISLAISFYVTKHTHTHNGEQHPKQQMLKHSWIELVGQDVRKGDGCRGRKLMRFSFSDLTGNSFQFDPIVAELTGWDGGTCEDVTLNMW